MTSIWSRVQRVLGAEAHAAVDRTEDPQTMLAHMQRELVDAIGEVRLAAARATAWRKRTGAARDQLVAEIDEAAEAARTAVAADNEPMARAAIERRRSREQQLGQVTRQLAQASELVDKLVKKRERMARDLGELRARRAALEQRSRFAESVTRLDVTGLRLNTGADLEPIAAVVDRMEDKVLACEARADAVLGLDALDGVESPEASLDDYIAAKDIDAELEALRVEMNASPTTHLINTGPTPGPTDQSETAS